MVVCYSGCKVTNNSPNNGIPRQDFSLSAPCGAMIGGVRHCRATASESRFAYILSAGRKRGARASATGQSQPPEPRESRRNARDATRRRTDDSRAFCANRYHTTAYIPRTGKTVFPACQKHRFLTAKQPIFACNFVFLALQL